MRRLIPAAALAAVAAGTASAEPSGKNARQDYADYLDAAAKQGRTLSPREFAQFLHTLLDSRQREVLREIMRQPTNP